ncbi:hypothetical protein CEXT_150491 [Caerostris extrusa]|uniref:Uncharacterized protein n=1 Tax=Caerostris extrusa TaxID=172846 RepID=A0AAV4QGD2_CAEEX|nr:hypothetical protein CEXT_150491 [Caerostris extrusa]
MKGRCAPFEHKLLPLLEALGGRTDYSEYLTRQLTSSIMHGRWKPSQRRDKEKVNSYDGSIINIFKFNEYGEAVKSFAGRFAPRKWDLNLLHLDKYMEGNANR